MYMHRIQIMTVCIRYADILYGIVNVKNQLEIRNRFDRFFLTGRQVQIVVPSIYDRLLASFLLTSKEH